MIPSGVSLSRSNYVPILQSKQGEMWALQNSSLVRTVPLIQVVNFDKISNSLSNSWPSSKGSVWLQAFNVNDTDEEEIAALFTTLFTETRDHVDAVPVLQLGDTDAMTSAVKNLINILGRGMVLRIDAPDIIDIGSALDAEISRVLSACESPINQTHLVVDLGTISGDAYATSAVAEKALEHIGNISSWMSVVTSFSAFPLDLSGVSLDSIGLLPRDDAKAYRILDQNKFKRDIVYGDYAVGNPMLDTAKYLPIPNIKYTRDEDWAILRGYKRDEDRTPQYLALAQRLTNQDWYKGSDFSAGDAFWNSVASGAVSPGSPTTAVRAAVSHHLALVENRLSSLGEP